MSDVEKEIEDFDARIITERGYIKKLRDKIQTSQKERDKDQWKLEIKECEINIAEYKSKIVELKKKQILEGEDIAKQKDKPQNLSKEKNNLQTEEIMSVETLYLKIYNGKTLLEKKEEISQSINKISAITDNQQKIEDIYNIIIDYLAYAPGIHPIYEHFLKVCRRMIFNMLNKIKNEEKEIIQEKLTEPLTIYIVKEKIKKKEYKEIKYKGYEFELNEDICLDDAIKLEMAELLSEMRAKQLSLSIFKEIIANSNKGFIYYLAKNYIGVLYQNSGLFEDAKKEFEAIKKYCNKQNANSIIKHFFYKHNATLKRRLFIDNLAEKEKDIIDELDKAYALFPTYHIDFSKGYLYYLIGQYINANVEFEKCTKKLGAYREEYYQIHMKKALNYMNMIEANDDSQIQEELEKFSDSILQFPNFKAEINRFLNELILFVGKGNTDNTTLRRGQLIDRFQMLLKTKEDLICIRKDIKTIYDYFIKIGNTDILKNVFDGYLERNKFYMGVNNVLKEFEDTFNRVHNKIKESEIRPTLTEKNGISICFDIRSFTKLTKEVEGTEKQGYPTTLLEKLKSLLRDNFSNEFDDVITTGSSFIFIAEEEKYSDFLLGKKNTLIKVKDVIERFSNWVVEQKDVPKKLLTYNSLGVGIACGGLIRRDENGIISYSGRAMNLSAVTCSYAKPRGIVICMNEEMIEKWDQEKKEKITIDVENELNNNEAKQKIKEEINRCIRKEIKDKISEKVPVKISEKNLSLDEKYILSSNEVDTGDYKYIYQFNKDEKRIFINYGHKCQLDCKYCITNDSSIKGYNIDNQKIKELEGEINDFSLTHKINDYLISLGHLNEVLDIQNIESTTEVVKLLLESTSAVIQIATKEKLETVKNWLDKNIGAKGNDKQPKYKDRIVILYSITTIKYSGFKVGEGLPFENRVDADWGAEKDYFLNIQQHYYIVLYIKPFLPGITDTDNELMKFIEKVSKVIVGFPYLSKSIMHTLSEFCLKIYEEDTEGNQNLLSIIEKHYSYANYLKNKKRALPLEHPSSTNLDIFPIDVKDEIIDFVKRIHELPNGEEKEIYKTSPCIVASIFNKTCYTNVGSDFRGEISKYLCDPKCSNIHCLYNEKYKTKGKVQKLIEIIKNKSYHILDNSHSFDHLIRVYELAKEIQEKLFRNKKEYWYKGEKIKIDDRFYDILYFSCLTHDLGDMKLTQTPDHRGEIDNREVEAEKVLNELFEIEIRSLEQNEEQKKAAQKGFYDNIISSVQKIVSVTSFDDYIAKGEDRFKGLSLTEKLICEILEDADKIDAIGAIGIARCFSFKKNKGIYNNDERHRTKREMTEKRYASSITHFYEKLLHLYDLLNFKVSKDIAKERHAYLEKFLGQFLEEYRRTFNNDTDGIEKLNANTDRIKSNTWWYE